MKRRVLTRAESVRKAVRGPLSGLGEKGAGLAGALRDHGTAPHWRAAHGTVPKRS